MTAYRFVTLTCDGCGEIFDPGDARTVPEARVAASREGGWIRRGPRGDVCGICVGTHERLNGHTFRIPATRTTRLS